MNINRAHGGKKTPLTEFVLKNKKNIIGETTHYEEGARFCKKPNKNVIIHVDYKKSLKIKNPDFILLNFSTYVTESPNFSFTTSIGVSLA